MNALVGPCAVIHPPAPFDDRPRCGDYGVWRHAQHVYREYQTFRGIAYPVTFPDRIGQTFRIVADVPREGHRPGHSILHVRFDDGFKAHIFAYEIPE